jgi:hypothetical protein
MEVHNRLPGQGSQKTLGKQLKVMSFWTVALLTLLAGLMAFALTACRGIR